MRQLSLAHKNIRTYHKNLMTKSCYVFMRADSYLKTKP